MIAREQHRFVITLLSIVLTLTACLPVALAQNGDDQAIERTVNNPADCCAELSKQLAEQQQELSRDLRLLKRNIAALDQKLDEPGLQEAMAGVGYILGLCGIAALVLSRRAAKRPVD